MRDACFTVHDGHCRSNTERKSNLIPTRHLSQQLRTFLRTSVPTRGVLPRRTQRTWPCQQDQRCSPSRAICSSHPNRSLSTFGYPREGRDTTTPTLLDQAFPSRLSSIAPHHRLSLTQSPERRGESVALRHPRRRL